MVKNWCIGVHPPLYWYGDCCNWDIDASESLPLPPFLLLKRALGTGGGPIVLWGQCCGVLLPLLITSVGSLWFGSCTMVWLGEGEPKSKNILLLWFLSILFEIELALGDCIVMIDSIETKNWLHLFKMWIFIISSIFTYCIPVKQLFSSLILPMFLRAVAEKIEPFTRTVIKLYVERCDVAISRNHAQESVEGDFVRELT